MKLSGLFRSTAALPAALAWVVGAPLLAIAADQAGFAASQASGPIAGSGSGSPASAPPTGPGYADLVDLLEPAPLIIGVQVRKVALVEPERAKGLRKGWARLYVEARPLLALRGIAPAVATLSYLADVPLDPKGNLPAMSKRTMLLVARPVAGHPEMVQLVAPDAQLAWDAALEARVRAVLAALQAADAPSRITGVREASYVPGALVGEGETQIFLATADGSPAAITVVHQPGQAAQGSPVSWSVSFSEVVDAAGRPPAHDTLAWYRLACFLPGALPAGSNVSATVADQAQAADDYRRVIDDLGACGRSSH